MGAFRILALAAAALAAVAAAAVEVDGIAAHVGVTPVLKSEIFDEMMATGAKPEEYEQVRSRMIERLLVLKAAEKSKMTLQDWAVDNRVGEIVNHSFGGDRNKLMEHLTARRMSYQDWRKRLKEDMVVAAMRWQTVEKNVSASPSAMRSEYMKHPERYRRRRTVTVSVVLLSPDKAAKREEVSQALKEEPFADVARRYSSDSRAALGGKWENVVPEEVFKREVCDEIAKMPKGTMSKWIEIDGWCFLLRLDDVKPAVNLSFAEAYDEIERRVREEVSRRLYSEWMERLKRETYVKVY